jgi:transcriptional regulator with XRE-family HTH domain
MKNTIEEGGIHMNEGENKQIMAQNIKRFMDRKGVTNQQVCDALGFKYTTFMDWIKGVTYPRIGKVEAMAQYFGCEKSDLIEDKKEKPTVQDDGLSKEMLELIDYIKKLPEDKVQMLLQVAKSIR